MICPTRDRAVRLRTKVPCGHWNTMTFVAALRHDRIDAPWLLEGAMNAESFRRYIESVLAPTLRAGDLVIRDNLASHNRRVIIIRQAIRGAGVRLFLLPKYSPISTRSSRSSPS